MQPVDIDIWTEDPFTAVITSEEELNLFIEQNAVYAIEPINFEKFNLIIAAVNVGSTCVEPDLQERVRMHNDTYHFEIDVFHSDGLCNEVCDMAWMVSSAYLLTQNPRDQILCTVD